MSIKIKSHVTNYGAIHVDVIDTCEAVTRGALWSHIIHTADAHTRKWLVSLGWTPPGGAQAQDFDEKTRALMKHYCVNSLAALIDAQRDEIAHLTSLIRA